MIAVNRDQNIGVSLDGSNCVSITEVCENEKTYYQITADTLGGLIILRDHLSKDLANILFWDMLHEYEKGAKIYRF